MRPVLFEIFGWPIHSYGIMLALAFLIGVIGVGRAARKLGIKFDSIIDLGIWVLVGAVLGARLAYVITEYQYYLNAPLEMIKLNSGGLAFHGGLIGGFLAGYWFVTRQRLHPWKLADLAAPYIALGYAIVRIGCLLNGCCYGKLAAAPWGFACSALDSQLRYPTQIYAMLGSLILFAVLWRLRQHRHFAGWLFLLYIGLYSVLRFIIEFFREGPQVFPWLSLAQLVCVLLGAGAFSLIWWLERSKRGRT